MQTTIGVAAGTFNLAIASLHSLFTRRNITPLSKTFHSSIIPNLMGITNTEEIDVEDLPVFLEDETLRIIDEWFNNEFHDLDAFASNDPPTANPLDALDFPDLISQELYNTSIGYSNTEMVIEPLKLDDMGGEADEALPGNPNLDQRTSVERLFDETIEPSMTWNMNYEEGRHPEIYEQEVTFTEISREAAQVRETSFISDLLGHGPAKDDGQPTSSSSRGIS
jgi:hypothetical protein